MRDNLRCAMQESALWRACTSSGRFASRPAAIRFTAMALLYPLCFESGGRNRFLDSRELQAPADEASSAADLLTLPGRPLMISDAYAAPPQYPRYGNKCLRSPAPSSCNLFPRCVRLDERRDSVTQICKRKEAKGDKNRAMSRFFSLESDARRESKEPSTSGTSRVARPTII